MGQGVLEPLFLVRHLGQQVVSFRVIGDGFQARLEEAAGFRESTLVHEAPGLPNSAPMASVPSE